MSAAAADNNNDNNGNTCANCGKGEEGSASLKACTACKLVKYCNRECQIAHRSQHKKACKKRATELHDEAIFKQPQPEDCPICLERMPTLISGRRYQSCCGKLICSGCCYAPVYDDQGNEVADTCPFCRTPVPDTKDEATNRLNKRVEAGGADAIYSFGNYYYEGMHGLAQNRAKAFELWRQAGELGNAAAYYNIGYAYYSGNGVEFDKRKARYYYELAAMKGHAGARYSLGLVEDMKGNTERAIKHHMIAIRSGDIRSLEEIRHLYTDGHASKQDYTTALRAYQAYLAEIKSDQRDKAAAAKDSYKYIE